MWMPYFFSRCKYPSGHPLVWAWRININKCISSIMEIGSYLRQCTSCLQAFEQDQTTMGQLFLCRLWEEIVLMMTWRLGMNCCVRGQWQRNNVSQQACADWFIMNLGASLFQVVRQVSISMDWPELHSGFKWGLLMIGWGSNHRTNWRAEIQV